MKSVLSIIFLIFFSFLGLSQVSEVDKEGMGDDTMIVIDELVTAGAKKVREKVIFSESKLQTGQSIPLKQLREELLASRQNLLNTRLFNDVELLIFKWTNENHVSIEFQVDERWYIYPIPVVELTGITVREWREEFDRDLDRLTYGISIDHNNLTGNADRLDLDLRGGFQRQARFTYLLTGVDKKRNWGLNFSGGHTQNRGASVNATNNTFENLLFDDFVFESQSAGVGITRRKTINKRHGLQLGFQRIEITDTIQDLSVQFFENDTNEKAFGTIGYNWIIENRDLSEYPTNGESIAASAIYLGLFENNIDQVRITGNINVYRPLSEKFYISSGLHARYTPFYPDGFFTLANSRTIARQIPRGYFDFQIFPVNFVTLKSELRYQVLDKKFYKVPIPDRFKPVPLKIYPKVYLDIAQTGAADFDNQNPLNNDFLYSYGAGIDIVTIYNTPLLIDVSRNHVGQTRLNFGIGKSF